MKKTKPSLTGALALLLTLFVLTPFAGGAAPAGTVVTWGTDASTPPPGLSNVVAIGQGRTHGLALLTNGTVVVWDNTNTESQTNIPSGLTNVMAIAAGRNHSLALRSDGTVVAWGLNDSGQTNVPPGLSNITAIAGGATHSLALKNDGTVVAWGNVAAIPPGLSNVIKVTANSGGGGFALRGDSTVVKWENNFDTFTNFYGSVVAVSAQFGFLALRADGTVVDPFSFDQDPVPMPPGLSGVVAIDVGSSHALALKNDGTVVGWGRTNGGAVFIPSDLSNVVAISTYERASMALRIDSPIVAQPPQITQAPTNQTVMGGGTAVLTVSATGTPPLSYQWRKAGVPLAGQTASVLAISNVTVTAAGNYDVVVSGAGSVTSAPPATLTVLGPPIITSPAEVKGTAGVPLNYQITVLGSNATGFQVLGLPAGLTFNPSTGLISGAPAAGGQTDVTLVATNLYGAGFQTLTVKVRPVGTVVAWGSNTYGEGTVPADLTNVVTVSAGQFKSLALLNTGNVVEWGDTPALPPALGNVTAISAGFTHFLALLSNGTVVGGGGNAFGESTPPVGLTNVVSVTAGDQHSAALRQDGTVVAWGRGDFGQTNVPANLTNVIAIDAGGLYRTLALKADGTVVQWGSTSGIVIPPNLSNLVAIAAGDYHSLGLKQDGTVVGWGFNDTGQTNIPVGLTNVVAIAAGSGHSLALKANGTVVAWGTNSYGQFPIPAALTNGSNVVLAIAARNGHSLAVVPNAAPEPPTITLPPQSQTVPAGGTPYLFVSAAGTPTLRYQWFKAGVPVGGATNALFGLPNIQPPQAGGYYVVVTNAYGAVTSSVATLTVNAPGMLLSQNFEGGTDLNLYQSLSAPGIGQFNTLAALPGASISVTNLGLGLGNSLLFEGTNGGSLLMARTTDIATNVGAVNFQFRFTTAYATTPTNNALFFQMGTNLSFLTTPGQMGSNVAAQLGVDLRPQVSPGNDTWGWNGSTNTFPGGRAGNFPLVTWVINHSGSPLSYTNPNGGNSTLGTGRYDLWVGETGVAVKVFDGAASPNPTVPLRTFTIRSAEASVSYALDDLRITALAPEAQPRLFFTQEPRSQAAPAGSNVTLSASVEADGPVTYAWYRNGSSVPGPHTNTLTLTALDSFKEGYYHLTITGLGGTNTSRGVFVVALPVEGGAFAGSENFTDTILDPQKWGMTDFADAPSLFQNTLFPSGGRLEYTQNSPEEAARIRGWKQGAAPGAQDWEARVTVAVPNLAFTNDGFVTAGLAVLNSADPGDRVVFELDSGSEAGGAYRQFTAINVANDADLVSADVVTNTLATNATLRARWVAATARLHLEYDADGPANGEAWTTLRVLDPAAAWGAGATNSFLIGIFGSAAGRTLTSADGVWLDNFATSGGSTGTPPVINSAPQGLVVAPGSNVVLQVSASGLPSPAYQWRKDGILLANATNVSLMFMATNRQFAGSYTVIITNAFGSITSSPALLRVLVPQRLLPPERLGDGRIRLLFGDQDGGFMSTEHLAGFEVYATTNLFLTNSWVRLTNGVSLNNGQLQLEDSDAPGLPRRFYRVIER